MQQQFVKPCYTGRLLTPVLLLLLLLQYIAMDMLQHNR